MKRFYVAFGLLLVVALAAYFLYKRKAQPVNVLFLTIDTLRSDHCSGYGYARKTTPRLDALALEGVRFETAYAPMATTAGSHATMFTSRYPISHGVVKNGYSLSPEFTTLAESFQKAGYETSAIVSSFVLHSKFGLSQGFTSYDDHFSRKDSSVRWKRWQKNRIEEGFDRRAEATANRAIQLLSVKKEKPFFLWVHFFDPHSPYEPVKRFRSRFSDKGMDKLEAEIAAYDEEILSVDFEIGRVLDAIDKVGLGKNTLVVVTADHGEGLMQHERMGHGHNIYEEAVKVPLLFRWPERISANRVVSEPVELVDLTATILNLTGVSNSDTAPQGIDLSSVISGKMTHVPDRDIHLQRRAYENQKGDKYGIRRGNLKYIESREENLFELYDLKSDPGELINIYDPQSDRSPQLVQSLEKWRKANAGSSGSQEELSDEDAERLKALGYVQ